MEGTDESVEKKRKLDGAAEGVADASVSTTEVKGEDGGGEKKVRRKRWGECVDD